MFLGGATRTQELLQRLFILFSELLKKEKKLPEKKGHLIFRKKVGEHFSVLVSLLTLFIFFTKEKATANTKRISRTPRR